MVNRDKQEVKVTGGLEEPSMCLRKTLSRYSARVCRCLDCGFICPSGNTCTTNITQLHTDTQMTGTPVHVDKDTGKHIHIHIHKLQHKNKRKKIQIHDRHTQTGLHILRHKQDTCANKLVPLSAKSY